MMPLAWGEIAGVKKEVQNATQPWRRDGRPALEISQAAGGIFNAFDACLAS
jgi:hypothetical protein